jgi:hypothetical protein
MKILKVFNFLFFVIFWGFTTVLSQQTFQMEKPKQLASTENKITAIYTNDSNEEYDNEFVKPIYNTQSILFDSTSIVDSVIITLHENEKQKISFAYDSNGSKVREVTELLDNNKWVNNRKKSFSYNSDGLLILELNEEWYGDEWLITNQKSYGYNSYGKLEYNLSETWEDGKLLHAWRSSNNYDANGNLILELFEYQQEGQWVYSQRTTYIYENDNLITRLLENWDGNKWVNYNRINYVIDNNGNKTLESKEVWSGDKWANYYQYHYTYDVKGNTSSIVDEIWNDGQWWKYLRRNYEFDQNNNMTLVLFENWENNQWVKNSRKIYEYNIYNRLTLELFEIWDEKWSNDFRVSYSYDSGGEMILGFGEMWENNNWVPAKNSLLHFYDSFGRYYIYTGTKIEVHYNTITDVKDEKINVAEFTLSQNYPNPFNPSTTIVYSLSQSGFVQLKLYDILGNEVANLVNMEQGIGNYKIKLNASSLASGVYFYKISVGNFTAVKKLNLIK